jgi:hypothetical protein
MLEKDENLSDRLLGLKREILKRRSEKSGASKGEEVHAVQN